MEKLTQEKLQHIERLLDEREKSLRDDIRREVDLKDNYAQIATEAPDTGDASFADLSVDLGNAAVMRDLAELRAIEAACVRIKNGVYGECLECGYEIPYARLCAQPTAERCAPCQDIYEKTHADAIKGSSM
ncbi:MAG TPA: TraR/DksA family transcriptional regulator [Burkholderiaceae bacterium]|nr:TraR/DksA family transcriptional regulator [Burkholderiaceae bacterium]